MPTKGQSYTLKVFKKIPFLNTIKYIFVFKEGNKPWELVPLKNTVLTDHARST
jgi:hypothetical protein